MPRWQPGESGNPKGRPKKGATMSEWFRHELGQIIGEDRRTTAAQELAHTLVRLARDGDVAAAKLVLSYVDGLPVQALQHSGQDSGPLVFTLALGEHHDDE